MDEETAREQVKDHPMNEDDDSKGDSSVTDSFSEDDIDYSPSGCDVKTIPGRIQIEQNVDQRLESLIKLVTEDKYMTGRTLIYHNIGNVLPKKTEKLIENLKRAEQFVTGSTIFLTESLSDTLSIIYPNRAIASTDALIFSPNFPVTILTIPDSNEYKDECRAYNTFLASLLTATLRDTDASLSVLHGIVDVNDDLTKTLAKMLQQKLIFAFEDSVTMTPDRCMKDLNYLVRILSSRETNEAMQKPLETSVLKVWIIIDQSDPSFGDLLCRLTSEFNVVLYIDERASLDDSLRNKLIANRVMVVDRKQEQHELGSALYLECYSKQTFCSIKTLWDEMPTEERNTEEPISEISKKIHNLVVWDFVACIVEFILGYKGDIEGSFDFAKHKIIPVAVLLMNVARLKPDHHKKEYWFLTSALFCSCFGDVLFVWSDCVNFGIVVFAAVNIMFATAFEFRLDNLRVLSVVSVLGAVIFQTISVELEWSAYFIVFIYTPSVCLLVWRAIAGLKTCARAPRLVILQVLSLVCFVACNSVSCYKFCNPNYFPGADILSKLTYNFTVLGGTMCLLFRYEMFGDNRKSSRQLESLLILSSLLIEGMPLVRKYHLQL